MLIRHWVGIAKKMEFSEEYRAELRARVLMARQKIGRGPALRCAEAFQGRPEPDTEEIANVVSPDSPSEENP